MRGGVRCRGGLATPGATFLKLSERAAAGVPPQPRLWEVVHASATSPAAAATAAPAAVLLYLELTG